MKNIFSFTITVFFFVNTNAQVDYSGGYGFRMKAYYDKSSPLKPNKEEAGQGKRGDLILLKIDSAKYKFWLSVNRGWPSYSQGNIAGIIDLKEDKAAYSEKQEFADSACVIVFAFGKKYIEVEQRSSDHDCGFGFNVSASGSYEKNNARRLRNADLVKYYKNFTTYMVMAERAFLFEDAAGNVKKGEYFVKDDVLISTAASENFVYVEYITTSGAFMYGWIKKSEAKSVE